ncbi:MAG: enoyl-CoA hydratase/isomerase family protein [Candidatus Tectomicrobia bacterium]
MYENVTLERQAGIATITMNRADRRNSLADAMLSDLSVALGELRDDRTVQAVVFTGAPPVFSAGADAPNLKGATSDAERREVFGGRKTQFRRLFGRVTGQLESLDQPVVCAINGHAVGGGWGLTLACDFRFASEAALFWLPEVDLGSPLGVGSTTRLVRMAGEANTKEIIMACDRYTAAQAQAMGLVHRVVPSADLMAEARAYAEKLAAKPLRAIAQVKANVNAIARSGVSPVMVEPGSLLAVDE